MTRSINKSIADIEQALKELIPAPKDGEWKNCVIASGETASNAVDVGKDYDLMEIQIPTITSADLTITTAEVLGGTYQTLGGSSNICVAGTGAFDDVFVLGGWRFIKVVSSAAQGAVRTFRVRGVQP